MKVAHDATVACRGVSIAHASTVVVRDLDLEVHRGELVALLGPSGSGKTTLLSALAGFVHIRSGEIAIGGRVVSGPGRHEPPERRDVGVVFQSYALWPHMSALETIEYPIRRRGVPAAEAHREAVRILELLGIGALGTRRPAEMSGGEQQRVGLGRALARNAGTYLFDEPTAHLDAALRERLQAEISQHRRSSGAAAVYATHDTTEALALADRVVLLREGAIVQQGSPATAYERPRDAWAARLTGPASIVGLHVTEAHDGRARVEIDGTGHLVRCVSSIPLVAGEVQVLVRPDWVRLGGELKGRVDEVAFRGTHTDYRLVTPVGTVGVRAPGPPTVARGTSAGWTLDRIWILAHERDRQGPDVPGL